MGEVLKRVWQKGARLEGWNEYFNFARWQEAFEEFGLNLGADAIQGVLDFIPDFVLAGFGVAANILPAMGFAMLGRLVLTKQLVPFYFLGFLLCSYANVPVLGVALIAIIIGIDKFDLLGLGGAQPQLSAEGDEDDDF